VSLFVAFAVNSDPTSTLAKVSSFIPFTAPMTLPPRILVGEASAAEIVGGAAVTVLAAAALIPLAARVYEGAVMRTGSAVRLRDAWRAARA
jgi:ABC-2 type transport system permease protein